MPLQTSVSKHLCVNADVANQNLLQENDFKRAVALANEDNFLGEVLTVLISKKVISIARLVHNSLVVDYLGRGFTIVDQVGYFPYGDITELLDLPEHVSA